MLRASRPVQLGVGAFMLAIPASAVALTASQADTQSVIKINLNRHKLDFGRNVTVVGTMTPTKPGQTLELDYAPGGGTRKKKLMANADRRGNQLVRGLKELQKQFPGIKAIRGVGLMIGVELDFEAKDFIAKCAAQGLIVIAAGTHTFRLTPPLIISKSDVEEALAKLEKAFVM